MKALVCTTPGTFSCTQIEFPQLQKNHAIIKIKRIGVCGTDLHAFQGTQPYFAYPRILGHEISGELIDFDNAPGFRIGENVTCVPYFYCGTCIACRNGKSNCCIQIKVLGVHIDGAMTEYISVPSYSLVHGRELDLNDLALVEPMAIGAHAIQRAGIVPGEFVLVVGAGPIGLGTMEFARIAGANVIALDTNESRLQFCRDQLKVYACISARSADINGQLLQITNGDMPTTVFDATGNLQAINNSLQYLAHGGRYVLIGLQKEAFSFSHPEFHKRESTLMSSRNATHEDFEQVISCIIEGRNRPGQFITHPISFDRAIHEFPGWMNPANNVIKAVINL